VAVTSLRRREKTSIAALWVAAAVGASVSAIAVLMVAGVVHVDTGACLSPGGGPPPLQPPGRPWWGWLMVAAALGAFSAGHASSHVRNQRWIGSRPSQAIARRGSLIAHGVLVGVLCVMTVLAGYETISVAVTTPEPAIWPLSYYVRCADDAAPEATLAALAVVSFLFGHWLGHPWRGLRERLSDEG
jgi:hypothetical protein